MTVGISLFVRGTAGLVTELSFSVMGFESPSLSFEFNLALASLLAFIETQAYVLVGYFIGIRKAPRDTSKSPFACVIY